MSETMIADTPIPPYYATIFTSILKPDHADYAEMATKMEQLAKQQPGYFGLESARQELGITVSYWRDEESIHAWKEDIEHTVAQKMGRDKWYRHYKVRVCKIERDYEFTAQDVPSDQSDND